MGAPGTRVPSAAYVAGAVALAEPVLAYWPATALPVTVQVTEPPAGMIAMLSVP